MSRTARDNLVKRVNESGAYPQPFSSEFSDIKHVETAGDAVSPEKPSDIDVGNRQDRIVVSWSSPSKDIDGSECNDFLGVKIYYSSSPGIDIDDDATYEGTEIRYTESWSQPVDPGNYKYYKLTSLDQSENESPPTDEYMGTSLKVEPTSDVTDFSENISNVEVGNHIIGIEFQQPSNNWTGFSRYILYEAEDSGSGFGSWYKIFEGQQPGFMRKGLNSNNKYKYKLAFIDNEGNETDGTVKDNGGSGYQPNQDNSNITTYLFVGSLTAADEITGNEIYAESSIVLGGIDNSGYIKSSNYDPGNDGFQISADGSAEFNNVTVRGSVYISGGEGITNLTDAGDLSTKDKALVSNGDVGIDGDLTVTGNLQMANNDVQLGASVPDGGGGTQEGLYIKNGGAYIEDAYNRVIFDTNGQFTTLPTAGDLNTKTDSGQMTGDAWTTMLTINDSDVILGGLVMKARGDEDDLDNFQVRISDNSGSETLSHPISWNDPALTGYGSTFQTGEWAAPGAIMPLPTLQVQGSATLEVYNDASADKNWQIMIWYY